MKIDLDTDNNLSLRKTLEMPDEVIFLRSLFNKKNKFYPQVFLEECLNNLAK